MKKELGSTHLLLQIIFNIANIPIGGVKTKQIIVNSPYMYRVRLQ